jgi:pimeloyl-ACP methyl ester carboxylesterase
MTDRCRIWIEHADGRIALAQWGVADSGKPPVLLSHGTSFIAEVWDEVATVLASRYVVYALDRRGHGASHKPAAGRYHFVDYASDVCAVVEALDLSDIFGIGHSAGATDLLLAAKLLPRRFSRLFVMEPTIMDPRANQGGTTERQESSGHAGSAAPSRRIRQRRRRVSALSRSTCVCAMDRARTLGLHTARF